MGGRRGRGLGWACPMCKVSGAEGLCSCQRGLVGWLCLGCRNPQAVKGFELLCMDHARILMSKLPLLALPLQVFMNTATIGRCHCLLLMSPSFLAMHHASVV